MERRAVVDVIATQPARAGGKCQHQHQHQHSHQHRPTPTRGPPAVRGPGPGLIVGPGGYRRQISSTSEAAVSTKSSQGESVLTGEEEGGGRETDACSGGVGRFMTQGSESLGGGTPCERCNRCCVKCSIKFTKFFLVLPNLLFLLFGSTLIGLGVWMRSDRESLFYLHVLQHVPASPLVTLDRFPLIIIVIGSLVAILSFLGCCGACVESVCFLCLYTFFLILVVTAEIVIAIVIVFLRQEILSRVSEQMELQVRHEYGTSPDNNETFAYHFTGGWDNMQTQFQCCGVGGPNDYADSKWYNMTREKLRSSPPSSSVFVPPSCCFGKEGDLSPGRAVSIAHAASQTLDCQTEAFRFMKELSLSSTMTNNDRLANDRYRALKTQGCKQAMINVIKNNMVVVISVVGAIVLLQVVDFLFACVFMRWVRKRQEEIWSDDENIDCGD